MKFFPEGPHYIPKVYYIVGRDILGQNKVTKSTLSDIWEVPLEVRTAAYVVDDDMMYEVRGREKRYYYRIL